jgi:Sec-independent protein translocase protein TatA
MNSLQEFEERLMFGSIGMPELIIILVIAPIIFSRGSSELGRSLGKSIGEFEGLERAAQQPRRRSASRTSAIMRRDTRRRGHGDRRRLHSPSRAAATGRSRATGQRDREPHDGTDPVA